MGWTGARSGLFAVALREEGGRKGVEGEKRMEGGGREEWNEEGRENEGGRGREEQKKEGRRRWR